MTRHRPTGSKRQPLPGARSVAEADPMQRLEISVLVRGRQGDLAGLTNFAAKHGLTVIQQDVARPTVVLSGTVAQFNAAFGVKLESRPPELIELTAGVMVASWDAVTTCVAPMLAWRNALRRNPRVTLAAR